MPRATRPQREVTRLALVGGTSYDEPELRAWLSKLRAKHPYIILIVGHGRGAEQVAATVACELGFDCRRANWTQHPWDDGVNEVNYMLHPHDEPEPDGVVLVGTQTGTRVKRALDLLKRIDSCRDPHNRRHVMPVALPEKTAKPKTKARPRKKREAVAI